MPGYKDANNKPVARRIVGFRGPRRCGKTTAAVDFLVNNVLRTSPDKVVLYIGVNDHRYRECKNKLPAEFQPLLVDGDWMTQEDLQQMVLQEPIIFADDLQYLSSWCLDKIKFLSQSCDLLIYTAINESTGRVARKIRKFSQIMQAVSVDVKTMSPAPMEWFDPEAQQFIQHAVAQGDLVV